MFKSGDEDEERRHSLKMIHKLTKIANMMHLTGEKLAYQKGVTFLAHPVDVLYNVHHSAMIAAVD